MSNQSETTQNSLEEDVELEDLIWNLMNKTGFLSEMKGKIAKFIHENGCPIGDGYTINSSRAHPRIMTLIYEYLQWVGMKNTCGLLLTESPVEFDTDENRVGNPPKLVRLLDTSLILINENGDLKDKSLTGVFNSPKNSTYIVKSLEEKIKESSMFSEVSSKSLISHNSEDEEEADEQSEKSVSSVKFEEIKEKEIKNETEKGKVEETESLGKEKEDDDDLEMESISELMNDLDSISENTIDISVGEDSKAAEKSLDHVIKLNK